MYIQEITITKQPRIKGSPRIEWNVAVDGVPFGKIYTYKARGEYHPYSAKTADGENFAQFNTYADAENAIRGWA